MDGVPVLVICPDERWLPVLEVLLKLGGFQPVARRSVRDAMQLRAGEARPSVVVLDLGADSEASDIDAVRVVLGAPDLRLVVILPERLAAERERLEAEGVTVVGRPYRPSRLYRAVSGGRGDADMVTPA